MKDLQTEDPDSPQSSQKSKRQTITDEQTDIAAQGEPIQASSDDTPSADASLKANRGKSDE